MGDVGGLGYQNIVSDDLMKIRNFYTRVIQKKFSRTFYRALVRFEKIARITGEILQELNGLSLHGARLFYAVQSPSLHTEQLTFV